MFYLTCVQEAKRFCLRKKGLKCIFDHPVCLLYIEINNNLVNSKQRKNVKILRLCTFSGCSTRAVVSLRVSCVGGTPHSTVSDTVVSETLAQQKSCHCHYRWHWISQSQSPAPLRLLSLSELLKQMTDWKLIRLRWMRHCQSAN